MSFPLRLSSGLVLFAALFAAAQKPTTLPASDADWPAYGGDPGGQRYSRHAQINTTNVDKLQPAWVFHTDSVHHPAQPRDPRANFEATPVFWQSMLFFDTPYDEIFALDATTGHPVWSFDPAVDRRQPIYIVSSRGVALWHGKAPAIGICGQHRVFVATLDRRLIARDAATGVACPGFGDRGTVDLAAGLGLTTRQQQSFGFTSPPIVVGDVVIVGSSVADNQTVDVAPGAVRAFDVRTGRPVWSWDPIPWAGENSPRTGSGNAWSIMSADAEHDLVFIPTGSASVDFYGGLRPGDNRDADSLVALRASTGQRVWGFQLVHHDLWDYDTPSQPLLFTFRGKTPAVAITGKTGMTFVLNRLTGEPLYPVFERPVPASDLPGEKASPTQPFSSLPTLSPLRFGPEDITLTDTASRDFCRKALASVINNGIFTPPSLKSTLLYPGSLGGANWGSSAFDPAKATLYVHTDSFAYILRQNTRFTAFFDAISRKLAKTMPSLFSTALTPSSSSAIHTPDGGEITAQEGTPYELYRMPFTAPSGLPCAPAPFGAVVAINLNTGIKRWTTPLGSMVRGEQTGTIGMGGPLVTAGGLLFIGASSDPILRALDSASGRPLWSAALPAPASATPMSFAQNGTQYIVVAAGGHGMLGTAQSDAIVAFALPQPSREKPVAGSHARKR